MFNDSRRLLLPVLLMVSSASIAQDLGEGSATWQARWHNDLIFGSDNQFTNGVAISKHSQLFNDLASTQGTPAFGKRLARWFLPAEPDLRYRESWSIGHNLQTPSKLKREDIILDDLPYMGMIGWSNAFSAMNDRRFVAFGMLLGWVGESVQGEATQRNVHKLIGSPEPKGWDNQLSDEPIANVYYVRKWKLWQHRYFDVALGLDGAAGNFITYGQAALELRFGDLPDGFAFTPLPVGRGLDYDPRASRPEAASTYASLVLRGTEFVHVLPRDGNLLRDDNRWTENNTIEPESEVGQVVLGLHYERPHWGVHLNFWYSTDTVRESSLAAAEDPRNNFGTLAVEWRY